MPVGGGTEIVSRLPIGCSGFANPHRGLYFRKETFIIGPSRREAKPVSQYLFGVQPRAGQCLAYAQPISLKHDLKWGESRHLQDVLIKADFWAGFPEEGLRLITAETKPGGGRQRVDLLFLRDDGGVIPCELKLGGRGLDTHGQLIRYIADLVFFLGSLLGVS